MKITFSCDGCGAQFTVDGQLAGRAARCNKCGRKLTIPAGGSARQPVGAAAGASAPRPARDSVPPSGKTQDPRRGGLATSGSAARGGAALRDAVSNRPIGWLDAVNSQIGLKPITMASMPALRRRVDEEEDDGPAEYKVVVPRDMRKRAAVVAKPAELARAGYEGSIRSYRQFFNKLAILFRWINETAYGISLIFLNVAIVGAIMSKHSLVVLGISLVVLLNVIQLIAGVANLIAIHFRGNVVRGLLFLVPPVTVYYLWTGWYRWNKAIHRVLSPIVWLVVVIAAYTYIPWLNGSKEGKESWREAVETIRKDVKGTVSEIREKTFDLEEKASKELDKVDVEELKKSAGNSVEELKSKAEGAIDRGSRSEKRDRGGSAEPSPGKAP